MRVNTKPNLPTVPLSTLQAGDAFVTYGGGSGDPTSYVRGPTPEEPETDIPVTDLETGEQSGLPPDEDVVHAANAYVTMFPPVL